MGYSRLWAGSSTAEQLTLNQLVESSNLSRLTSHLSTKMALGTSEGLVMRAECSCAGNDG